VRRSDGVQIRVVSAEKPAAAAVPAAPSLEDAYLHCISLHRGSVAA
jgi:hypothetical protein